MARRAIYILFHGLNPSGCQYMEHDDDETKHLPRKPFYPDHNP